MMTHEKAAKLSDVPFVTPGDLDPGVRRLVLALRAFGFKTVDSGDGVSKKDLGYSPDAGEMLDVPHVVIVEEPGRLHAEAGRLLDWCNQYSETKVAPIGQGRIYIESSYDVADGSAVIILFGMTDEDIASVSDEMILDMYRGRIDRMRSSLRSSLRDGFVSVAEQEMAAAVAFFQSQTS